MQVFALSWHLEQQCYYSLLVLEIFFNDEVAQLKVVHALQGLAFH